MTGPRPIPDPEPIAWSAVAITMLVAGLVGGGVARWLTRRWDR